MLINYDNNLPSLICLSSNPITPTFNIQIKSYRFPLIKFLVGMELNSDIW